MAERYPMHRDEARSRDGARLLAGLRAMRDRSRLAAARQAPRCNAWTRRGTLCQAPACAGRRRCRMHGGRSLAGAAHGRYVHGWQTREARAERRAVAALLRACDETLRELREVCGGAAGHQVDHG